MHVFLSALLTDTTAFGFLKSKDVVFLLVSLRDNTLIAEEY
jgi:hypothetical protein